MGNENVRNYIIGVDRRDKETFLPLNDVVPTPSFSSLSRSPHFYHYKLENKNIW